MNNPVSLPHVAHRADTPSRRLSRRPAVRFRFLVTTVTAIALISVLGCGSSRATPVEFAISTTDAELTGWSYADGVLRGTVVNRSADTVHSSVVFDLFDAGGENVGQAVVTNALGLGPDESWTFQQVVDNPSAVVAQPLYVLQVSELQDQ